MGCVYYSSYPNPVNFFRTGDHNLLLSGRRIIIGQWHPHPGAVASHRGDESHGTCGVLLRFRCGSPAEQNLSAGCHDTPLHRPNTAIPALSACGVELAPFAIDINAISFAPSVARRRIVMDNSRDRRTSCWCRPRYGCRADVLSIIRRFMNATTAWLRLNRVRSGAPLLYYGARDDGGASITRGLPLLDDVYQSEKSHGSPTSLRKYRRWFGFDSWWPHLNIIDIAGQAKGIGGSAVNVGEVCIIFALYGVPSAPGADKRIEKYHDWVPPAILGNVLMAMAVHCCV